MATVREIADHLNVSPATVSRVLNSRPGIGQATRQRVLDAASEMGLGRSVGLKTSRYVGFVHPLGRFIGNMGEYHAAMVGGIASTLAQHQYDLALVDPYRDKRPDETYAQFFMRKELHGLVIQVRDANRRVVEAIAEEGFPMVLVAARHEHPAVSWAVIDSGAEFANAVAYLHRLGHRRVAIATRDEMDFDHRERWEGYRRACRELDLPTEPELEQRVLAEPQGGASAIRRLMSLPEPPTAVLFTDPGPAIGALRACHDMGVRVPDDLSLVGFDDSRRRYDASPVLTSVCQDAQGLGEAAAGQIVRLLEGHAQGPEQVVRPAIFEVHETTGPPPAGRPT